MAEKKYTAQEIDALFDQIEQEEIDQAKAEGRPKMGHLFCKDCGVEVWKNGARTRCQPCQDIATKEAQTRAWKKVPESVRKERWAEYYREHGDELNKRRREKYAEKKAKEAEDRQ